MNDKQKVIGGFAILGLAVIGCGVLHFQKLGERSEMKEQIARHTKQVREAQEKIKRIPGLRAEREKLVSVIDEYSQILPKEEHVQHDAFVDIIDSYRRDTEIIIQKAEYVPIKEARATRRRGQPVAVEEKDFFRHRYKFKLLGTVPELIEFVNKIENHTRFLKIDALKIKPLGAAEDTGTSDEKQDEEELAQAAEAVKEIELTISTYTYYKGPQQS
jgi:hypothetical protein